jgi:hypothetical protein
MLNTFIESEEDYNAFFRPAIMDSIRQVLKFYGLDSTAQIYYNGENEIAKLVGNNATDDDRAGRYTDGVFRNKIFITPEVERHEFNSGYGNQRRMATELTTWSDEGALPLRLTPCFEGRRIRVGVTAYFNSRQGAKVFVNRISRLQANQVTAFNISATVHLVINPQIIEFMKTIHGMLVDAEPLTPELPDWFDAGCKTPVTTISNVAGNQKRMAAPMRLDNIGVYFDDPETKLSRLADQFGKYEVTLGYNFFFQEFMGWELEYPLMVYQQQIPEAFIPAPQVKHVEQYNKRVAPEVAFGRDLGFPDKFIQAPYYLKLPAHDPWAWQFSAWVQPIVQARCVVQDVELQALGNIFDLPGYQWNEQVKAYMLRRRDWAFSPNQTPFIVQVFSNDRRVHPPRLSLDENGVVWLSTAPEMKNTYRVVVCLDWAIRDYTDTFWDDMRNNPADRVLVESFFTDYDWNQFDGPWIDHLYEVRQDIAKGWGKFHERPINTYTMNMGLTAFTLIEEIK